MSLIIARHIPIKFYQVKHENETMDTVCQKFNISPDKVEHDNPNKDIKKGDMLVLHIN